MVTYDKVMPHVGRVAPATSSAGRPVSELSGTLTSVTLVARVVPSSVTVVCGYKTLMCKATKEVLRYTATPLSGTHSAAHGPCNVGSIDHSVGRSNHPVGYGTRGVVTGIGASMVSSLLTTNNSLMASTGSPLTDVS